MLQKLLLHRRKNLHSQRNNAALTIAYCMWQAKVEVDMVIAMVSNTVEEHLLLML
jgi:hypothetical protein